jgi:uncharacterized membrane protein
MAKVEKSIEVDVPVATAYNQWTQFEEFPQFMDNVESVTQVDDTHLRWSAEIGGKRHEWDAEIVEQEPDRRIAWRSLGGVQQSGVVTFEPAGSDGTCVTVELEWEPQGVVEKAGAAVGADARGVDADLERFKEFIEARGVETGAWRGKV